MAGGEESGGKEINKVGGKRKQDRVRDGMGEARQVKRNNASRRTEREENLQGTGENTFSGKRRFGRSRERKTTNKVNTSTEESRIGLKIRKAKAVRSIR